MFLQRGSNSENVFFGFAFFVDEGTPLKAGHHWPNIETPFKCCTRFLSLTHNAQMHLHASSEGSCEIFVCANSSEHSLLTPNWLTYGSTMFLTLPSESDRTAVV